MTVKWKLGTIQLMWPACRYGYFTKSRVEGGYRFPVDPLLSLLGAGREKPWERGLQSRTLSLFGDVILMFLYCSCFLQLKVIHRSLRKRKKKKRLLKLKKAKKLKKRRTRRWNTEHLTSHPPLVLESLLLTCCSLPSGPVFLTPRLLPPSTVAYMHG